MPVLRKRETVNTSLNMRPVQARPLEGMAAVQRAGQAAEAARGYLRETTADMTRKAADFARGMAAAAEEEAKALAKAAVFSTGPNGLPQLPPNVTERMGRIARRTYDATIEDRFAHQMQTAIKGQINDARNANMYDLDGFIMDAESRISQMALDIPPGYEGMFQQISSGLMVDTGASIGYAQAQLQQEEAAVSAEQMAIDARSLIVDRIWRGEDEDAQAMIEAEVERIRAARPETISPSDKVKMIDDLYYEAGLRRMFRDFGIDENNLSSDQLAALNAALQTGKDERIIGYFTRPDANGEPIFDRKMAERAGYKVQEFMGVASARDAAVTKQAETAFTVDAVMAGKGSGTAKEKEAMDIGLGERLGLDRPLMPEDWAAMDDRTRTSVVQAVKDGGFESDSLATYFRTLEGESDPDALTRGFMLWRDLREQANSKGVVRDLSGVAGARMGAIFARADNLHAGGTSLDLAARDAVAMAEKLFLQDQNKAWDDRALAAAMNRDRTWLGTAFGARIDETNVRDKLAEIVDEIVFPDMDTTAEERAKAIDMLETHIRIGATAPDAIEYTRQQQIDRYAESSAMGKRSAFAPEVHFPDPPAQSFGELFRGYQTYAKGMGKSVGEVFLEAPNALIPNFIGSYSVGLGADFDRATVFERAANVEVQKMIEGSGLDLETVYGDGELQRGADGSRFLGNRFLKPGRDYTLEYARPGKGGKPVYRVTLKQPGGISIQLDGELDVTEEYRKASELTRVVTMFEDAREKHGEAYALDLFKGKPEAHELLTWYLESSP